MYVSMQSVTEKALKHVSSVAGEQSDEHSTDMCVHLVSVVVRVQVVAVFPGLG